MIQIRRRFLMIVRFTMFLLQILCCIATIATFSRLLDQYKLPNFFMFVPVLLFFLTGLERCYFINDYNLNSIIRGAITGFLSGFYSTVVNDVFSHSSHTTKNHFILSLGQYEFLHIPVICGSFMCFFFITFTYFPPLRVVILSFALAVCSMALFSIGTIFFSDRADTTIINKTIAFVIFICIFLLGLTPFVSFKQRLWLFSTMVFMLSLIWQSYHLDSCQWQWKLNRFPIPGTFFSIIFLFLADVIQVHTTRENNQHVQRRRKKRSYSGDCDDDKYKIYYNEKTNDNEEDEEDSLSNALTWHCVCYVLERTTLTLMMEKQHKRKFRTDTWICCLGMFFIYMLYVNYRQVSLTSKLLLTYIALLAYFCIGVTGGIISNGYLFDSISGIVFLTISTLELDD